jgi:hypothetical protein
LGTDLLNLRENNINPKDKNFVILHTIYNTDRMNRAEIEYLKKVNDIRKKMGLALDPEQCNRKSFLPAIAEITSQKVAG